MKSALAALIRVPEYLVFLGKNRLVACSSSGTSCSTSQLNGAYNSFFGIQQFQSFVLQFANFNSLTKSQVGNVDSQSFRNYVIQSSYFQLTHLEYQLTTSLNTFCQTFHLYRNFHNDRLSLVDLIEVNVQDSILYGVELDIFHDSVYFLAINHQVNYVDVRSVNQVTQTLCRYSEVNIFTCTIKYARYTVVFTNSFQSSCLFRRTFCNSSCSTFYFN